MDTYRSGSGRWIAWSSRIVSVALKVCSAGVVPAVSCYAPTFAASREEDNFYGSQQEVLFSIPSQECCVTWAQGVKVMMSGWMRGVRMGMVFQMALGESFFTFAA